MIRTWPLANPLNPSMILIEWENPATTKRVVNSEIKGHCRKKSMKNTSVLWTPRSKRNHAQVPERTAKMSRTEAGTRWVKSSTSPPKKIGKAQIKSVSNKWSPWTLQLRMKMSPAIKPQNNAKPPSLEVGAVWNFCTPTLLSWPILKEWLRKMKKPQAKAVNKKTDIKGRKFNNCTNK